MRSPYEGLSATQFWRTGVAETHPLTVDGLYTKKFPIERTDKIAAAGSCFAQHISSHLRAKGFSVLDYEPAPPGLPPEIAKKFGCNLYSARYGNIYAVRQLLQLAQDSFAGNVDAADFWTKDGRYYDALRPNVEPEGFESLEEAMEHRREHLKRVEQLFTDMSVFVFTFGLTEAWVHRQSGRVYATAPGTIAGDYDPAIHAFKNFTAREIYDDFVAFCDLIKVRNANVKVLLTVSPVPLTATASEQHVLIATTYSKSVLRTVAGELYDRYADIDYFPSYEIIASPWSRGFFYESNLRSVNSGGVNVVMQAFFAEHAPEEDSEEQTRRERKMEKRSRRRAQQESDDAVQGGTEAVTGAPPAPSAQPVLAEQGRALLLVPRKNRAETSAIDEGAPLDKSERRARRAERKLSAEEVDARKAKRRARRAGGPDTLDSVNPTDPANEDAVCEEVLLDAFSR